MAEAAVQMHQEGPAHPLQCEKAYLDGSHLRCVSFKTLALFRYIPAMYYILRSHYGYLIRIKSKVFCFFFFFWSLMNEVLAEITSKPENTFKPKAIKVNEHGANFCSVRGDVWAGLCHVKSSQLSDTF